MTVPITDYKILVVDSSALVVERLNGLLKEMNCIDCVTAANTYGEALEKLSADKCDFVLLDTRLPGKNGFELLSYIKRNYPDIKTIMLTNQTSDFYRNKGQKIGADHFIDKSSEFDKVTEIIKNYSLGYQMN